MSEPTYRQERKKIDPSEITGRPATGATLEQVQAFQRAAGLNVPEHMAQPAAQAAPAAQIKPMDGVSISGQLPPQLQQMLQARAAQEAESVGMPPAGQPVMASQMAPHQPRPNMGFKQEADFQGNIGVTNTGNASLDELLSGITNLYQYDAVHLPSMGRLYERGPANGTLHVRPMTGREEQYLATQRYARGNAATNAIFKNCIRENIDVSKLLVEDRTYLLIFLRGISYGTKYDVQLRCESCSESFEKVIDLDSLPVTRCPETFTADNLIDKLPVSNYRFKYRLPTGEDEVEVSEYRQRNLKQRPDSLDDTFFHRATLLLDYIGNDNVTLTEKHAIKALLPQMPVADINYLRNVLNEPPFGVDTDMMILCPACYNEFNVTIPMELSFFFPKNKKEQVE
jgi:hypothetical protein